MNLFYPTRKPSKRYKEIAAEIERFEREHNITVYMRSPESPDLVKTSAEGVSKEKKEKEE